MQTEKVGLNAERAAQMLEGLAADTPAAQMRILLRYQLAQGVPFAEAWRVASSRMPRGRERQDWANALRFAKPHFQASYEAALKARPALAAA